MFQKPMRVASVGLGQWAQVIASAVARSDKLEIVNCYSRSPEKRAAFAQKFNCDQVTSYEKILAAPHIEGVLLTTPNTSHAETIEQAVAAGKHVWVEKPVTHTMSEAMHLKEILNKSDVTFAVGHNARRLGASRKMKALLDTGQIGKLSLIEAHWSNERAMKLTPESWRWYADSTPGGPLTQLLVHHFDTIQYLAGPITEVQAYKRRLNTPAEVDDVATVVVEFESGQLGYLGSSWVSPGLFWMHIYGTEANLYHELKIDHWQSPDVDRYTTLSCQPRGTLEKVPVEIPKKDMFRDELEDFVAAARNKRQPEVGWLEATRALACVEAAIRSSNNKRPVTIAELMC